MAYHDELLLQAAELVHKEGATQADLRRAVSAAYYSLFHLLISETVANWSLDSSRNSLARMFEHRVMAKASESFVSKTIAAANADPAVVQKLPAVARAFSLLQEKRHTADYDNGTTWSLAQALNGVQMAQTAFRNWSAVRTEKVAQDYLVSLLIKPRS